MIGGLVIRNTGRTDGVRNGTGGVVAWEEAWRALISCDWEVGQNSVRLASQLLQFFLQLEPLRFHVVDGLGFFAVLRQDAQSFVASGV